MLFGQQFFRSHAPAIERLLDVFAARHPAEGLTKLKHRLKAERLAA